VKARGIVHLAGMNLRADWKGSLVNAAAACVGAAALAFFVALGLGVGDATRRLFPGDARLVEVVPPSVSLGGVLGGGKLDDDALSRLAAIPGVEQAYRKLNLRVPIAASRPPDGVTLNWPAGFTAQIPAVGVDPGLVAADLAPGLAFRDGGPDAPVPVMASKRLLEIYNKTIAPAWNLRRLPPGLSLLGVQLPVRVGFSIVPLKTEDRVYDARLQLVGLSERVPVYQLAVPLDLARRLHKEYGKPDAGYTSIVLLAARPDDVPAVVATARRMGFDVDEGERAMSQRVGTVVAVTSGALTLLALIMCALAALAIAQSLSASVRARVKDIAVLQAVGASAADVRALVLAEAGMLGLSGGMAGALLARLSALGADATALRLLPDFPFRPDTFFAFSPWIHGLAIGVAVSASVLGALGPARAAARVDPARSLS
jgi:putative ABC transport system permease protein